MASSNDPRYVRVTCPTCRAVLHPRVEKAGRRVRCPDCYSAVLVPQPAEAVPEPPRRDPGEYQVRDAAAPPQPESTRNDDYFRVLCPVCSARLHPRRRHTGKKTRCPDCDTVFTIPPPPVETKPNAPPPVKPYPMGQAVERPPVEMELLTVQGRLEPEPPPPEVPRHWFASGVFTFPWRGEALARSINLSLLLLPLELLLGVILFLAQINMSYITTVVPLLAVPMAWLALWAGSYAAACFLAIVQDTGSGSGEIHNWPEGDWRERVAPLAYLSVQILFTGAAASVVAIAVGALVGQIGAAIAIAVTVPLLFPLFLLSAMEADSPLMPYSPVMVRSLWRSLGGWLTVYLESLGLLTLVGGLLAAGLIWAPMLAIVVASPLLTTAVFVVARLYGRLAWRIGQQETGRRKRRKKKSTPPAVSTNAPPRPLPAPGSP